MPYRDSSGSKIPASTKARLLNLMNIDPDIYYIVVRGECHKINVKEIME